MASGSAAAAAPHGGIDMNLYSRQFAVFGEAMGKLVQLDVLIIGMRGLGIEIAKNIILAGPHSVTIYDPNPTSIADVGLNFYLRPEAVGTPRGAAVVEALAELNPYVSVHNLAEPRITEEVLAKFHVVVATDAARADLLQWDAYCRSHVPAIGFIAADVRGAAGYAFVDFGPEHIVRDLNGEQTRSAIVTEITKGNPATVFTHDAKRHGFEEGDHVIFREVEGMTQLNDGVPRRIKNVKPFSFEVEVDTTGFDEYTAGGAVEQVKVPVPFSFASLADRITAPLPSDDPMGMLLTPDLGKFGRSEQLHVAFHAIELYRQRHGHLPRLRDEAAIAETVSIAKEWAESTRSSGAAGALNVDVDADVVATVARLADTELPALDAFFGGVVAQEIVKFTGKFTPLRQWLYLDAFEVLPTDNATLPAAEWTPSGSRYDNLYGIFGRTFQAKIAAQRVFVVGAGALGCEFLKDYAMMGVGTGPQGRLTVTDMDRIEVSNLNRQFLFRSYNVGQPKSVTAAAAARVMNPDLKVEALETPVGEDTETTFDDEFWEGLDVVTNALDNLKARQYVDGRCIFYSKPLLESGTLGTKANTQVIVPYKTECYSDSVDPPEESIPMCTLRNFPHAIEHCIEWARDLFAGTFTNTLQEAASFAAAPREWLSKVAEEPNLPTRRGKLEGVLTAVKAARSATFETCVETARQLFNNNFVLQIKQLLHNFPVDYVDPATQVKFWSGPKRPPTAAEFDPHDPVHFGFVVHAAALVAANYGVKLPAGYDTPEVMLPILAKIHVPEFVPKSVKIKASETDTTVEGADDDRDAVAALTATLSGVADELAAGSASTRPRLEPAEFEKDDDTNHHIDFIAAASNLRARNYKIKEATRYEVKLTAGRIIPAIATTTAMVTGLVCIEFYKVVRGAPVEQIRNSFVNLANNIYSMGEPAGPKRTKSVEFDVIACGPVKAIPEGFTRWDRLVVREGNLTAAQFQEWLQTHHKLELNMITSGKCILYNPMVYKSHRAERANTSLKDLIEQISGAKIQPKRKYILLDISCSDEEGNDTIVPQVQLYFA